MTLHRCGGTVKPLCWLQLWWCWWLIVVITKKSFCTMNTLLSLVHVLSYVRCVLLYTSMKFYPPIVTLHSSFLSISDFIFRIFSSWRVEEPFQSKIISINIRNMTAFRVIYAINKFELRAICCNNNVVHVERSPCLNVDLYADYLLPIPDNNLSFIFTRWIHSVHFWIGYVFPLLCDFRYDMTMVTLCLDNATFNTGFGCKYLHVGGGMPSWVFTLYPATHRIVH